MIFKSSSSETEILRTGPDTTPAHCCPPTEGPPSLPLTGLNSSQAEPHRWQGRPRRRAPTAPADPHPAPTAASPPFRASGLQNPVFVFQRKTGLHAGTGPFTPRKPNGTLTAAPLPAHTQVRLPPPRRGRDGAPLTPSLPACLPARSGAASRRGRPGRWDGLGACGGPAAERRRAGGPSQPPARGRAVPGAKATARTWRGARDRG